MSRPVETPEDRATAQLLLAELIKRAPNAAAQASLSKDFHAADADNRALYFTTCALADGVLYGNWPWR